MERIKIIKELAQYAHPSWYHMILNWRTETLVELLNFYKEDQVPDDNFMVTIGVDFAAGQSTTMIGLRGVKNDMIVVDEIREPIKNVMKFKH